MNSQISLNRAETTENKLTRSAKITYEVVSGQDVLAEGHILAQRLWNYTRWCCFGYNEKLRQERGDSWEVFKRNQSYIRTGEGYPGKFTIQTNLKDYYAYRNLSDRCSSYTIKDFDGAVRSWFVKSRNNPESHPPSYAKYPRVLNFEQGKSRNAKHLGNWIFKLTVLGGHIQNRHAIIRLHIKPGIKAKDIKLLRLQPDGTGVVTFSIEQTEPNGNLIAGIDLGVINLAVVAINNGQSILYSGKGLISAMQWQKKRASACKPKGWEKGKQESRPSDNQKNMLRKAGNIQKLAIHNLTTHIIKTCQQSGVAKIIIGDLTGIRDNNDFGNVGNQKFHIWPFAEIRRQIEYKAQEVGIEVIAVNERGTSSHCCFCGSRVVRNPRGVIKCKECGAVVNSDLNGAFNILNKVSPVSNEVGVEGILPALPSPLPKSENRRSSQIVPTFVAKFNLRNWAIEQTRCEVIP